MAIPEKKTILLPQVYTAFGGKPISPNGFQIWLSADNVPDGHLSIDCPTGGPLPPDFVAQGVTDYRIALVPVEAPR